MKHAVLAGFLLIPYALGSTTSKGKTLRNIGKKVEINKDDHSIHIILGEPDAIVTFDHEKCLSENPLNRAACSVDEVETYLPDTKEEKIQAAWEVVRAHGQSDDAPKRLPGWLEYALS